MRALVWQGNEHVEVTDVPNPVIQEPNDIIVWITSTAICGSDLHLYRVLGPFLKPGRPRHAPYGHPPGFHPHRGRHVTVAVGDVAPRLPPIGQRRRAPAATAEHDVPGLRRYPSCDWPP